MVFRDNLGLLAPIQLCLLASARTYLPTLRGPRHERSSRRSWLHGPRFQAGGSCSAATRGMALPFGFRRRSVDIPSRTPHQGCANHCDDGRNSRRSSGNHRAPERVHSVDSTGCCPVFSVRVPARRVRRAAPVPFSDMRQRWRLRPSRSSACSCSLCCSSTRSSMPVRTAPQQVLYIFDTAGVSVRVGHSTFDTRMLPPERYDEIKHIYAHHRGSTLSSIARVPPFVSTRATARCSGEMASRRVRFGRGGLTRSESTRWSTHWSSSKLFAHLIGATRTPAYYVFQPTEQSDYIGPPALFGGPSKFLDRLFARWYGSEYSDR